MPKVKLTRNPIARFRMSQREGMIVDVPDKLADELVGAGYGEYVDEKPDPKPKKKSSKSSASKKADKSDDKEEAPPPPKKKKE